MYINVPAMAVNQLMLVKLSHFDAHVHERFSNISRVCGHDSKLQE